MRTAGKPGRGTSSSTSQKIQQQIEEDLKKIEAQKTPKKRELVEHKLVDAHAKTGNFEVPKNA